MTIRHTEMLNRIISHYGFQSYLEIGLGSGYNFQRISCPLKHGVDPAPLARPQQLVFQITSDEYFQINAATFDCIFIDGLHHHEQVLQDVYNSLEVLNEGGLIMVHDCNPPDETAQQVPRGGLKIWTGDVWRAWVELRRRSDLHQVCIAEDYGCGIIYKSPQPAVSGVDGKNMPYDTLHRYREELLNLVSWQEYERLYLHS